MFRIFKNLNLRIIRRSVLVIRLYCQKRDKSGPNLHLLITSLEQIATDCLSNLQTFQLRNFHAHVHAQKSFNLSKFCTNSMHV